jgi:hypothetical protein
MITIETKEGNVKVDKNNIYLISSGLPWEFGSIIMLKQGEDIFSTSPICSVKATLESRQGIYLKDISTPWGTTFLVHTKPFSQLGKKITPKGFVPHGTMGSENRVEHPNYYKLSNGIEVLDIVRDLPFNIGNVVKYVIRAGKKKEAGLSDKQKQIEDLEKAKFYLEDAIKQLEDNNK